MSSVYVARQPIFELGRGLYGYELLYRRDTSTDRADGDHGYMSAEVIANALLGVGMRTISAVAWRSSTSRAASCSIGAGSCSRRHRRHRAARERRMRL